MSIVKKFLLEYDWHFKRNLGGEEMFLLEAG